MIYAMYFFGGVFGFLLGYVLVRLGNIEAGKLPIAGQKEYNLEIGYALFSFHILLCLYFVGIDWKDNLSLGKPAGIGDQCPLN